MDVAAFRQSNFVVATLLERLSEVFIIIVLETRDRPFRATIVEVQELVNRALVYAYFADVVEYEQVTASAETNSMLLEFLFFVELTGFIANGLTLY